MKKNVLDVLFKEVIKGAVKITLSEIETITSERKKKKGIKRLKEVFKLGVVVFVESFVLEAGRSVSKALAKWATKKIDEKINKKDEKKIKTEDSDKDNRKKEMTKSTEYTTKS